MALTDLGAILSNLTEQTLAFLPNIIGAVILLVIGLVVGKVVGRIVVEILDRVKLDYYVTEEKKPVISMAGIFAMITRWWIYLAFITSAVSVLQIAELTQWMRTILGFVPNIIGAAVIMVVGYVLAEYIKSHLRKTGNVWAVIVAKTLFFFVMYVAIALALQTLGVSTTLINSILLVIIGSVGLGMAIAMGLGLKEAIAEISKKWVRKLKV